MNVALVEVVVSRICVIFHRGCLVHDEFFVCGCAKPPLATSPPPPPRAHTNRRPGWRKFHFHLASLPHDINWMCSHAMKWIEEWQKSLFLYSVLGTYLQFIRFFRPIILPRSRFLPAFMAHIRTGSSRFSFACTENCQRLQRSSIMPEHGKLSGWTWARLDSHRWLAQSTENTAKSIQCMLCTAISPQSFVVFVIYREKEKRSCACCNGMLFIWYGTHFKHFECLSMLLLGAYS